MVFMLKCMWMCNKLLFYFDPLQAICLKKFQLTVNTE